MNWIVDPDNGLDYDHDNNHCIALCPNVYCPSKLDFEPWVMCNYG